MRLGRQAQHELRAAGARRSRTQRRAHAAGAARGRAVRRGASNREIAAELFLAPKTIEFHLHQIYRKPGVRSRTQLVATLTRDALAKPPAPGGPERRIAARSPEP